jgi:hypothetical protein
MNGAASQLLAFYRGTGTDPRGRLLAVILAWDHERLESVHDYIQWLFPLDQASAFNPRAPVLGRDEIETFRADVLLRQRLRDIFLVMLDFYGLELSSAGVPAVVKAPAFPDRARVWLSPGNHNHLRLTRILKSLTLLGMEELALALFRCLEAIYRESGGRISTLTYDYWHEAVARSGPY